MTYYDEQLQQLQEQLARKRQLGSQAAELRRQRDDLSARVRELETVMLEEQASNTCSPSCAGSRPSWPM